MGTLDGRIFDCNMKTEKSFQLTVHNLIKKKVDLTVEVLTLAGKSVFLLADLAGSWNIRLRSFDLSLWLSIMLKLVSLER